MGGYQNGSAIIIPHLFIVDIIHIADMDESYDEYYDNHDYDDNTDDVTADDTDDDNDHKKDSYTAAGAAPDAGAAPTHTGPYQDPHFHKMFVYFFLPRFLESRPSWESNPSTP